MIFIILFLFIIICILAIYLFLEKKEFRRLKKEISKIKNEDTNLLLHTEFPSKEFNEMILELNKIFVDVRDKKIDTDRKNNQLMKMMTNISHDLRTPLTSAIGYIDMILHSNISEEDKINELHIIEGRLKKLEELINSFFEFSKIISDNKNPEIEKVNLNIVLENCIANYYEDYKNANREIILNCTKNKIIINSNRKLLTRIFDNLIGNAYKHSISNLEIKVDVKSKIVITFMNDLQYKELDIDKMFDEFYTVDISRTKGNTGLGLAIAKEFTEQLNGKIYADKSENKIKIVLEFSI